MRIFRNTEIESVVESRLAVFENRHGKIANPPVPIDNIIEDCGLSILYDKVDEKDGEVILGGLNIEDKEVIINESHMQLFRERPGLERFTKAHELGHWDIFVDKSRDNANTLFNYVTDLGGTSYRESLSSGKKISVLINAWADEDIYHAYKMLSAKKDHPNVASAVNRYASNILMPKHLILNHIKGIDLVIWKELYKVSGTFGVTISALRVRLERLGIIYVKDRKIFRTKEELTGQNTFKFN